jgi:hypothetical protein
MAVTIDGTNGINDIVLGSSTPAAATVTTFTSNGIDDNADALAITIDSSENVGIGTSSASQKLDVVGNLLLSGQSTADQFIRIGSGRSGNGYSFIDLTTDTTYSNGFRIIRTNSGANSDNNIETRGTGALNLVTQEAGPIILKTSATERMRIDASGNVLVGTTANIAANAKIFALGSGVGIAVGYGTGSAEYRHFYMNSGDGAMYVFNNTNYGNFSAAGAWTNASDRRIKKNIVDIKYGLADVLKIQPRSYQMKEVAGDYIGLIAQEMEEIIPEVVSGDPEKQLTLDYGSLVAVAFKAIQEQQVIIESLKTRITALEG